MNYKQSASVILVVFLTVVQIYAMEDQSCAIEGLRGPINDVPHEVLANVITRAVVLHPPSASSFACVDKKRWNVIVTGAGLTMHFAACRCTLNTAGFKKYHELGRRLVNLSWDRDNIHRIRKELQSPYSDVNYLNSWGSTTPFYRACLEGVPEVVALYLKHGADIQTVCCGGYNPLYAASLRATVINPVYDPIAKYACLTLLCNHGVDVNDIGVHYNSALHMAVMPHEHAEEHAAVCGMSYLLDMQHRAVQLLIDKKADVNACEKSNNFTPLHYALYNYAGARIINKQVVRTLMIAGANPYKWSSAEQRTPYDYARAWAMQINNSDPEYVAIIEKYDMGEAWYAQQE